MASTESNTREDDNRPDRYDDFNFDEEMMEVFGDINNDNLSRQVQSGDRNPLGIDDEIRISKKRKPIAKLDTARLLSPAGIPKLQRIAKSKLKFRGKYHEFSDVALLLRTYQLWLDDLYPRAKFADGLAMIEKLGHSKQMQMERKQWIDENKPKLEGFDNMERVLAEEREPTEPEEQSGAGISMERPDSTTAASQSSVEAAAHAESHFQQRNGLPHSDKPEEDELDTLLGDIPSHQSHQDDIQPHEPEQAELDALFEEEERYASNQTNTVFGSKGRSEGNRTTHTTDFEDDEEALRELEMM